MSHTMKPLNEAFGNLSALKLGKMTMALRQEYRPGQTRNVQSNTHKPGSQVPAALKALGDTPVITNVGAISKWADIVKLYKSDGSDSAKETAPFLLTLHHNNKPVMMLIRGSNGDNINDGSNAVMGFAYDFEGYGLDSTEIDKIVKNTNLRIDQKHRQSVEIHRSPATSHVVTSKSEYIHDYDKIDKWKALTGNTSTRVDKEFNNFQLWKNSVETKYSRVIFDLDADKNIMNALVGKETVSTFDLTAKKGTVKEANTIFAPNSEITTVYTGEDNFYGVALQVKEIKQIFEAFIKAVGGSLIGNTVVPDFTATAKKHDRYINKKDLPLTNQQLSQETYRSRDSLLDATVAQRLLNDRLVKFKSERTKSKLIDFGTNAQKVFDAIKKGGSVLSDMFLFDGHFYKQTQGTSVPAKTLMFSKDDIVGLGEVSSASVLRPIEFTEFHDAIGSSRSYRTLEVAYLIKQGKFVPAYLSIGGVQYTEGL